MWIVRLALKQPYTFAVMALLILLGGVLSILRTPTDIFPVFNIPVVTVIWSYNGITPNDMEKRFVTQSERAYTTTVGNIEHIESESVSGLGIVKIYFQPGADIASAIAQVSASSQTILRALPPGTTPPLILRYDASDVPVLQATVSSQTESEQSLFDYAQQFIRTQLATVQGAQLPLPYGGRSRTINVDLDINALTAHGLTPYDVSSAIGAQNLILPTGDAKIGSRDYTVQTNSSPNILSQLMALPIRTVNGAVITIGDVAQVRDGYNPQTNIVNQNGRRAVLLTILKSGDASTIDVVQRVKAALPHIEQTIPPDVKVNLLADQSIFVKASVEGVIREAVIAACLTAIMILLFLGSVRSTLIVAVSIPLSILTSIIVLAAIGQTMNIMTLGGLALAVGILVDDTTVTIENIDRNVGLGLPLRKAIIEGAREIAGPALISTLCICIVFAPVAFLTGAAKSLFLPLALAVIFAMLASYLLSRTVTPTFAAFLLRDEVLLHREDELEIEDNPYSPDYERLHKEHQELQEHEKQQNGNGNGNGKNGPPNAHQPKAAQNGNGNGAGNGQKRAAYEKKELTHRSFDADEQRERDTAEKIKKGVIWRVHTWFIRGFAKMRGRYVENLRWALEHRLAVVLAFVVFLVVSGCVLPFIGRDFFPSVDAGEFRLHIRVPVGTRLEDTAADFAAVEAQVRKTCGSDQIALVLDNIGEPISVNLAYSDSVTLGPSDGEMLVTLKSKHRPTADLVRLLRNSLPTEFPGYTFFFQPGDIVGQILNFGLPEPIDVQVSSPEIYAAQGYQVAQKVLTAVTSVPGAVDVHMQQVTDYPELSVDVDRTEAAQIGLTQQNAADNLLASLAGTAQAAPSYYLNQKNGVVYNVSILTPQANISSVADILNTPVGYTTQGAPKLLGNIAHVQQGSTPEVLSHYNIQPVYDIYANNQDRDLGGVSSDISAKLKTIMKHLPRGVTITVRGQVQNMNTSFTGLGYGIIGALVLVYLLLVINFQSWLDPLVVVSGAPGALSGIVWMLFTTHTTLSVPSLMGAVMAIGVSTANSVLLITFANERRMEGMSAVDSVVAAGYTRLRPILMTALAMVIGMIPMALALGEGGEQNAPLGRAVIGGLLVATFTTLFIVPIAYTALRAKDPEIVDNSDLEDDPPAPQPKPKASASNDKNGSNDNNNGSNDGQDGNNRRQPAGNGNSDGNGHGGYPPLRPAPRQAPVPAPAAFHGTGDQGSAPAPAV